MKTDNSKSWPFIKAALERHGIGYEIEATHVEQGFDITKEETLRFGLVIKFTSGMKRVKWMTVSEHELSDGMWALNGIASDDETFKVEMYTPKFKLEDFENISIKLIDELVQVDNGTHQQQQVNSDSDSGDSLVEILFPIMKHEYNKAIESGKLKEDNDNIPSEYVRNVFSAITDETKALGNRDITLEVIRRSVIEVDDSAVFYEVKVTGAKNIENLFIVESMGPKSVILGELIIGTKSKPFAAKRVRESIAEIGKLFAINDENPTFQYDKLSNTGFRKTPVEPSEYLNRVISIIQERNPSVKITVVHQAIEDESGTKTYGMQVTGSRSVASIMFAEFTDGTMEGEFISHSREKATFKGKITDTSAEKVAGGFEKYDKAFKADEADEELTDDAVMAMLEEQVPTETEPLASDVIARLSEIGIEAKITKKVIGKNGTRAEGIASYEIDIVSGTQHVFMVRVSLFTTVNKMQGQLLASKERVFNDSTAVQNFGGDLDSVGLDKIIAAHVAEGDEDLKRNGGDIPVRDNETINKLVDGLRSRGIQVVVANKID